MPTTTLSSREFNQKISHAKKAARLGPVFITDRGDPQHVLLDIKEYLRLTKSTLSLYDALAPKDDDAHDFEFTPPRIGRLFKKVSL